MKIVYEHLLRFLVYKPDINELSEKLFQLGHEHEIDKNIFNMEFTPNRGDCLSLQGLIRDLNVFYETKLDFPIYENDISSLDLNFINSAQDKCPQISFLNIEIKGEVLKYKDYLEDYFIDLKINKNNFFTDISNYVAYELGQPTHSYDFPSMGNDITLKENTTNSKFVTLLGSTIDLDISDLVFTSEDKVINLSGIIGGMETACNKHTKNALIECAYFNPESVMGKSVRYNLNSEASYKFERGTDPNCHEKVIRRFIQIVSEHVEITKLELFTQNNDYVNTELEFDINKINKILGTNISKDQYKESLIKLGFSVDTSIRVPSFRSDINHQNDLAEELARVIGYNNLPVKSINLGGASNKLDIRTEESLKFFLVNNGFTEVVNSTFCSTSKIDSIKVDNPLDINRGYLRTNLTDSLVENLIYNEKRQKDSIKLFEISDIYTSSTKIHEKRLALIVSGRKGLNHLEFNQKLDNDYLVKLFKKINIDANEFISNIDRNNLDSKIKVPIFAIELKMEVLSGSFNNFTHTNIPSSNFIKYIPISEFPSSSRDLSFSVEDSSKIEEVVETLSNIKSGLIKDSFMFDFYENKTANISKIGYRFILQSDERTLTDIEIDKEINKIIDTVTYIESVSLPSISKG